MYTYSQEQEDRLTVSRSDLKHISGYSNKGKIIKWLAQQGISYKLDRYGFPVVSVLHFHAVLSGEARKIRETRGPRLDLV